MTADETRPQAGAGSNNRVLATIPEASLTYIIKPTLIVWPGTWSTGRALPVCGSREHADDCDLCRRIEDCAREIDGAYLDSEGLDSIPDPVPLIDGILFRDSLAWIAGRQASFKTFVALDMVGAVGAGRDWQGRPVCQGTVVYLIAEGATGIKKRVRAIERAYGGRLPGVKFLPMPVQATDAVRWAGLRVSLARRRPALVVIDTQARVTVGMNENTSQDMGVFLDQLEALRTACGACVLVLHHTARGGEGLRGSSSLEGGANTIITVQRSGNLVTLSCDVEKGGKQKDAPEFDEIQLRLVPSESSLILCATFDVALDQHLGWLSARAHKLIHDWWHTFGTDRVSVTKLEDADVCSKRSFYRYRPELVKAGIVDSAASGHARYFWLTKNPEE